jgi:tetratricopeptide (TPR) repeat protein
MDVITPDLARQALTAEAHEARADSPAQRRDFEAAAQAYRQAIESAPYEDEILHLSLGGVLSELGRHAQALANLEVAVQINPASEGVARNLAICRANVSVRRLMGDSAVSGHRGLAVAVCGGLWLRRGQVAGANG